MTYQKIANKANVSLSTVSKALSGSKEISEELREKIIRIAVDEGYFAKRTDGRSSTRTRARSPLRSFAWKSSA